MKVKAKGGQNVFYPLVCGKRALARCKQQALSKILEAEYHDGKRTVNANDTEKHSAEHFQMSAECHIILIISFRHQPFLVCCLRSKISRHCEILCQRDRH